MRFPFGFGRKPKAPPTLPEFYVRVRDYVQTVEGGAPCNEIFEATPLSPNGFTSLGFALVLLGVAKRHNVPGERLANFLRVGPGKGPDPRLPTLVQRATVLWDEFEEREVYYLLDSGFVGNRAEIHEIAAIFDNVDTVVRMAQVVRSLENETTFDR